MKEYKTIDKSSWARGEWDNEPDKVSWTDEATGLPCLIVRTVHHGALCGYVGVDQNHKYFNMGYDDFNDIGVHGGLTFADKCQHSDDESRHVCHVPEPGKTDNVWWFGFDCAHAWDKTPASDASLRKAYSASNTRTNCEDDIFNIQDNSVYRNIGYVKSQVESLALQLAAVK